MMGINQEQEELFSYQINLDERVRSEHPLRKVREHIDFSFVRGEVAGCYGYNGNVSVDPVVIMKMMFLLFFDDVASERELMRVIPERLDYMWFLGYGLNDSIPDHSVLSKARSRWGVDVFESLFVRIVAQCVEQDLVSGEKIHMDGCLVDANASKDSVIKGAPELIAALKRVFRHESEKFEDDGRGGSARYEPLNKGMMSTTDPDAPIVRQSRHEARPRYKAHRVVDDKRGVITATETTPGDVEENALLMELVDEHEANTDKRVETVVADTQYGTVDNFRACHQRGICSHMGDMLHRQRKKGRRAGIFGVEDFIYDSSTDTYRCPAGQTLQRKKHKKKRKVFEYACSKKICSVCEIRPQCTRAANGAPRTIKRHMNQEAIDAARAQSRSPEAKRDRRRRKWLMEGSFADSANNHGFKRARWRRLHNQRIQDYLIAAVQNVRTLLRHIKKYDKAAAEALQTERNSQKAVFSTLDTTIKAFATTIFKLSGLGNLPESLFAGFVPT